MSQQPRQSSLAVLPATGPDLPLAQQLADRLNLPLLPAASDPAECADADTLLLVSGGSFFLQQAGRGAPGPVAVDFGAAGMRHRRRSGGNELLGKAVGVGKKSPLKVLDATAGLGRDAFVLADLGCEVTLCEREPVIVELLRNGMEKALASGDPWLATVVRRMCLIPGDVRDCTALADVVYLDPMFPSRGKSAAVKKEMAMFQRLLQVDSRSRDAEALLLWALSSDAARVVVKRPARAPQLAGIQPSHCISGKAVRYDVYVQRKLC